MKTYRSLLSVGHLSMSLLHSVSMPNMYCLVTWFHCLLNLCFVQVKAHWSGTNKNIGQRWEMRWVSDDGGVRRETREAEGWKNREGVHMSWKTTTRKYLISYSVCSVIVCQTVLLYSWHQPSLPVCYHNKTISVKTAPTHCPTPHICQKHNQNTIANVFISIKVHVKRKDTHVISDLIDEYVICICV